MHSSAWNPFHTFHPFRRRVEVDEGVRLEKDFWDGFVLLILVGQVSIEESIEVEVDEGVTSEKDFWDGLVLLILVGLDFLFLP